MRSWFILGPYPAAGAWGCVWLICGLRTRYCSDHRTGLLKVHILSLFGCIQICFLSSWWSQRRFNMYSPVYLALLLFHLVTWYAISFAFASNWGNSSVNNRLLWSNMLLCHVNAGASTVFKDDFAFGERKTREKPILAHAVYSLGLYFEGALSEQLELDFNQKEKGGEGAAGRRK